MLRRTQLQKASRKTKKLQPRKSLIPKRNPRKRLLRTSPNLADSADANASKLMPLPRVKILALVPPRVLPPRTSKRTPKIRRSRDLLQPKSQRALADVVRDVVANLLRLMKLQQLKLLLKVKRRPDLK